MTGKWTPGPWYEGSDDSGRTISGYRFRDMAKIRISENDDSDIVEELEASTRLMATSPELAEALEECLSYIERHEERHGATFPCAEKARKAITKAKGETP